MNACVIGNGPSRLNFDLAMIGRKMTTYGCNALYRDYIPNYLVSMDFFMVDEILKKNIHKQCSFYTQHVNSIDLLAEQGEPINFFWGFKETNDSGNSALRLALQHDSDITYMIGFDYVNGEQGLPNVYSGTPNYCKANLYLAPEMKINEWRQRLNKLLLKEYPNKKVVRVNGNNNSFNIPKDNYSEITIEQFKEILND